MQEMDTGLPSQKIDFVSADGASLAGVLNIPTPLLLDATIDPHHQLRYVEQYVRKLECKSYVVEQHYIDRDFMEDHSIFYSKSLVCYSNYCRRVHFFSIDPQTLRSKIQSLHSLAAATNPPTGSFKAACAEFSSNHYLGFAVIKPLPGCPVGRTVLKGYPIESDKGYIRRFDCACDYDVHLLGIPLRVHGLAFQQQDLGVSACATTALWTSLQRARELEQSGAATPAQITIRASQFTLPFGRPMPSEGLSLNQMCVAIQSLGYSPNVLRHESFAATRALLYSAVSSGISPVLILQDQTGKVGHAVAVAGMAVNKSYGPLDIESSTQDESSKLIALYVHDDRHGPYVKTAKLRRNKEFLLRFNLEDQQGNEISETWRLSHILIPMHTKVRLSFGELKSASIELADYVQAFRLAILKSGMSPLFRSSLILRSYEYVESLLKSAANLVVPELCDSVAFPRYIGVIRLEADDLDPIDILLDTTGTGRNLNYIAIVSSGHSRQNTRQIAEYIASETNCTKIF
jgi:hypothetical protein